MKVICTLTTEGTGEQVSKATSPMASRTTWCDKKYSNKVMRRLYSTRRMAALHAIDSFLESWRAG